MLTPNQKLVFRTGLAHYCLVAEEFERFWHYDQARLYTGQQVAPRKLHRNDCSSYVGLGFGYAADHLDLRISDPLGDNWNTGNTDTAYAFLKAHGAPEDKYRIGDIALFLEREREHHHMMVCRKAGSAATAVWSSFGEESGPEPHPLNYRSDLTGVYRHPALL